MFEGAAQAWAGLQEPHGICTLGEKNTSLIRKACGFGTGLRKETAWVSAGCWAWCPEIPWWRLSWSSQLTHPAGIRPPLYRSNNWGPEVLLFIPSACGEWLTHLKLESGGVWSTCPSHSTLSQTHSVIGSSVCGILILCTFGFETKASGPHPQA